MLQRIAFGGTPRPSTGSDVRQSYIMRYLEMDGNFVEYSGGTYYNQS